MIKKSKEKKTVKSEKEAARCKEKGAAAMI
jgi:hypothetical protein